MWAGCWTLRKLNLGKVFHTPDSKLVGVGQLCMAVDMAEEEVGQLSSQSVGGAKAMGGAAPTKATSRTHSRTHHIAERKAEGTAGHTAEHTAARIT